MHDQIRRRFDSPEFIDALNQLYEGPTAPSSEDDENTYPDPKWQLIQQNEDAKELLTYLLGKQLKASTVDTLRSNWGRRREYTSREDIRSALLHKHRELDAIKRKCAPLLATYDDD